MTTPSLEISQEIFFNPSGETPHPVDVEEAGRQGKALVELAAVGAPVQPGVILGAAHCAPVLDAEDRLPGQTSRALQEALQRMQPWSEQKFGDESDPLLLTVRSSDPIALPVELSPVVNIGLRLDGIPKLASANGDARWAWDAYRRFAHSFGNSVLDIPAGEFDELTDTALKDAGVLEEHELDAAAMENLARAFHGHCESKGSALPQDPATQLAMAVRAGFRVWNHPRVVNHLRARAMKPLRGMAVIVQFMAHGNRGEDSGAGSVATRAPADGEKKLHGSYLDSAEVADLTAGISIPDSIQALEKKSPEAYEQLATWATQLERHFRDAVQIAFVIDHGTLRLVSCMPASRTPKAAMRIALDLVDEGISSEREALTHIDPIVVEQLMHPVLDKSGDHEAVTKGLPASPGSAVGRAVFFAEHAEELAAQGIKSILIRHETTPEDIGGLSVAEGILTATGGLTSHAAVVARGMGKCCIVGAKNIQVNYHINEVVIGDITVQRMDWISLDGNTGQVYVEQLPQIQPSLEGDLARVLDWADANRTLGVYANADNAEDARRAVELGAGGIGLCRTEHMFFDMDRIPIFRRMILAVDEIGRSAALADLLPVQRKDFMDIFRVMHGRPVTIRLLDPPLNEFLPRGIRSQTRMAKAMNISLEALQHRTEALTENNPMLGHRGCRLAITYPEIYNMQVRAIVEAACIVTKENVPVIPEIMVPLISTSNELLLIRKQIEVLMLRVMEELGETIAIKIGTMVETPRAAICADTIAEHADFFSFGTNDLTQMGFGFSRDDSGMFLPLYVERGVVHDDPFVSLDREGIGAMVRTAVEKGRSVNSQLKIGVCGEHGGDPESITFFRDVGLDYVSCSPFRVPVARLAAAQADIAAKGE